MSPDPWTTDDFLREIGEQLERIADALAPAPPLVINPDDPFNTGSPPCDPEGEEEWIAATAEAVALDAWNRFDGSFAVDAVPIREVLRERLPKLRSAPPANEAPIGFVRVYGDHLGLSTACRDRSSFFPAPKVESTLCALIPVAETGT